MGLTPGWGRAPGEGHGTHSSFLAWEIPWTEKSGELYSPWGHKESNMTEHIHIGKGEPLKVYKQSLSRS